MRLNESMLERVEELFDLITCDESHVELNSAMDSLRRFLENDIDGWTNHCEHVLAVATYSRLEEILQLIPDEHDDRPEISRYFTDVLSALNSIIGESEFENQDIEYEEELLEVEESEEHA